MRADDPPCDPEPLLLSWSGGKDCAMALHTLATDTSVRVAGLLTTVTEGPNRISMHGVRDALLETQARRLGLPVTRVPLTAPSSDEQYAAAMARALEAVRAEGIRRVVFGDLFLADVRAYRETQLGSVGMGALFPLWGAPTDVLARDVLAAGFRAVVVCVDTEQIPAALCGRDYDESFLADLPTDADPCGEHGEFHTFVYDGPPFSAPVSWRRGGTVVRDGRFVFQDLLPA